MDDDGTPSKSRFVRCRRKRVRDGNIHLEEDSDHSVAESDVGSEEDAAVSNPCKKSHNRDSDESSYSDSGNNVDQSDLPSNHSSELSNQSAINVDNNDSAISSPQNEPHCRDSDESSNSGGDDRDDWSDSSSRHSLGSRHQLEINGDNINMVVNEVGNESGEENDQNNMNENIPENNMIDEEGENHQHIDFNHINFPAAELSAGSADESENSNSVSEESEAPGSDSEIEEIEEEDENELLDDRPLYDGAQISLRDSLLAILTFVFTHQLSGLCVGDLLSLIAIHCGPNNICLKTLFKFKSYFQMIGKKIIVCHFYCSMCEIILVSKESVCGTCEGQNHIAYFIEFPIVTQLQIMFQRQGFYENLMFRFNRVKKNENNIEDVYDGIIYQQLTNTGFLANRNNISFFMYFDGIALFKSSTFSIWPVYFSINELKYKLRTKKENTVLAGIWFGKSKPNPNLFLGPIQEKISVLENDGVQLALPNGDNVLVKVKLLGAVGDMPAKSLFMRLRQYNGAYSCFHCMEKGGRFDLGNSTVQVFPFNRNYEIRRSEDMAEFAQLALEARQADPDSSVYGVKGPALLSLMLPNIILCMAIDIMHGVFLGAMKTLAHLWFDTQYSRHPFSISGLVRIVDERLKNIKPPSSFTRVPRSLAKEIAQFKASDWKLFFFFYSLPVLNGILPELYWLHHSKLVTAISIFCQESISIAEIDAAENLLHSYVAEFQDLYGVRFLSLTFHQLLHMGIVVKHLGPAWVYSCFYYESLNGELARLVHGSRHAALQICSSSSIFLNLTNMIDTMPEGVAKQLCLRFQNRWESRLKISEDIDHKTGVVGKMVKCYPVPEIVRRLLTDTFNLVGGQCKYFLRLKKRGSICCSEMYVRSTKRLSCFVEIIHDGVHYLCKINSFVKWSSCDDNCPNNCNDCHRVFLCIVTLYERTVWEMHEADLHGIFASYLNKVSPTNEIRAFPVQSITSVCLYINIDGNSEYIALPVNKLEVE